MGPCPEGLEVYKDGLISRWHKYSLEIYSFITLVLSSYSTLNPN
jgi:hypothetical protein